jgi:hypothetical protein
LEELRKAMRDVCISEYEAGIIVAMIADDMGR